MDTTDIKATTRRGEVRPDEKVAHKPIRITIEVAADDDAVMPWKYTVELARPPTGLLLHS